MAMFSQNNNTMAPPQKPETFMLSDAAQQSLPQDAQVALQQVDNCTFHNPNGFRILNESQESDSREMNA